MRKIGEIQGNVLFVNLIAFGIAIFAYLFVYRGIWKIVSPQWARGAGFIFLIIMVILLMFAHEGIHMLVAKLGNRKTQASLHIRLFAWECRLKSPLTRNHYIMYALAPGLVLAAISLIVFYVSSSVNTKFLSAVAFVVGLSSGGGDYWFVSRMLRYPKGSWVMDHGLVMDILSVDKEDPV